MFYFMSMRYQWRHLLKPNRYTYTNTYCKNVPSSSSSSVSISHAAVQLGAIRNTDSQSLRWTNLILTWRLRWESKLGEEERGKMRRREKGEESNKREVCKREMKEEKRQRKIRCQSFCFPLILFFFAFSLLSSISYILPSYRTPLPFLFFSSLLFPLLLILIPISISMLISDLSISKTASQYSLSLPVGQRRGRYLLKKKMKMVRSYSTYLYMYICWVSRDAAIDMSST